MAVPTSDSARRQRAQQLAAGLRRRLDTSRDPTEHASLSRALTEVEKQMGAMNEATITPDPSGAEPAPEAIDWSQRAPDFPSSAPTAGRPATEAAPATDQHRTSDELIGALTRALAAPGEKVPEPRDLSVGERLTLALASTRPDTMANVVKPLLDERRDYRTKQAALSEKQRGERIDDVRAAIGPVQAQEQADFEREQQRGNLVAGFTHLAGEIGVQGGGLIDSLKETAQAAHDAGLMPEANNLVRYAATLQGIREYDSDHRQALGMPPLPATQADLQWFAGQTREAKGAMASVQQALRTKSAMADRLGAAVDKARIPNHKEIMDYTDVQTVLRDGADALALVNGGAGGWWDNMWAQTGSFFGIESSTLALRAKLENINSLWTPDRYGAALSPTEVTRIKGILTDANSNEVDIKYALGVILPHFALLQQNMRATKNYPDSPVGAPPAAMFPGGTAYYGEIDDAYVQSLNGGQ